MRAIQKKQKRALVIIICIIASAGIFVLGLLAWRASTRTEIISVRHEEFHVYGGSFLAGESLKLAWDVQDDYGEISILILNSEEYQKQEDGWGFFPSVSLLRDEQKGTLEYKIEEAGDYYFEVWYYHGIYNEVDVEITYSQICSFQKVLHEDDVYPL